MIPIDFKEYPYVLAAIQFGSSISGDVYRGSDIDLMIITIEKNKIEEENLQKKFNWQYQTHIYTQEEFREHIQKREPLHLSALNSGKILCGDQYLTRFKNYAPTEYTIQRCMLNSFVPLGLAISDILHGMSGDVQNSLYHAARSSIWATLFFTEVTPPNKRILELLTDPDIKEKYSSLIFSRDNTSEEDHDFDIDEKWWNNEIDDKSELITLLNMWTDPPFVDNKLRYNSFI